MSESKLLGHIPDRTRLFSGSDCWTIADLQAAVDAWTHRFDALDAKVVAINLPNGLEWVAVAVALLESDRVAVPLPSFFSDQQRTHALENSGATLLIESSPADQSAALMFRNCWLTPLHPDHAALIPLATALITYTSGSTGAPKGACLSAATLIDTARSLVDTLSDLNIQKHLCALPLTLLLENVAGLYANLLNGSDIYLPTLDTLGLRGSSDIDTGLFVGGVRQYQPDSMICVPPLLLCMTIAAELGMATFDNLKFVAVGGSRVSPELLDRAERQNIPAFEGYGLTECGSVVTLNTPAQRRQGSVGKLLPHVTAEIIDNELVVSAPRLRGYVGSPRANPDPVYTGDLASMDSDGFITIDGRAKNVFITAYGRNVSPEWIESELQNELPISLAMVCGEAQTTNTALIVPRGEVAATHLQAAVSHCNERLPDYARVARWYPVSLADLTAANAITGNGRIKRAEAQHLLNTLRDRTEPQKLQGAR